MKGGKTKNNMTKDRKKQMIEQLTKYNIAKK